MTRRPISTYRLQIRRGFDLEAAAEVTSYLEDLGVSWVYLSPLLASEPGSTQPCPRHLPSPFLNEPPLAA